MNELYIDKQSLIHSIDARVKLILTLAFLLALNLTPSGLWIVYLIFLCITGAMTLVSKAGFIKVLRRSLVALPFVLAALPLIFTGPVPKQNLMLFHSIPLVVSLPGTRVTASIILKSWISVQAAILLAATTPMEDLLRALRQLGIPGLFVSIISLMWRYLAVISDEVTRMLRARASRSTAAPGLHPSGGNVLWRAKVTGGMAGSLLLRSVERSERVYAAMLSRGYNGDLPHARTGILSRKNQITLILGLLLLVILWGLSLAAGV